jgi:hypothetical protein
MEMPVHNTDFASPYLHQLASHQFDEFYSGSSACFLELLGMALGYILPESSAGLSDEWQILLQWIEYVRARPRQFSAWDGVKTEVHNLVRDIEGVQSASLNLDNTQLFETITLRFGISIVWFEEGKDSEIRTKFYRYPVQNYQSYFVYMGSDMQQNIYAFHHIRHRDTSSNICVGIADSLPPIHIGSPSIPSNPNDLFIQLATAIVNAANAAPIATFSHEFHQHIASFMPICQSILPSLQPPLDPSSLSITLQRFLSVPPEPDLKADHHVSQCEQYPNFAPLVSPHGDEANLHYIHLSCLKKFVKQLREKYKPARCPKCTRPLSEEILEGMKMI